MKFLFVLLRMRLIVLKAIITVCAWQRELLRDKVGNIAPLSFVPVVRGGLKTYTMRGAVVAPLFNNIGTEEATYRLLNGLLLPIRVAA